MQEPGTTAQPPNSQPGSSLNVGTKLSARQHGEDFERQHPRHPAVPTTTWGHAVCAAGLCGQASGAHRSQMKKMSRATSNQNTKSEVVNTTVQTRAHAKIQRARSSTYPRARIQNTAKLNGARVDRGGGRAQGEGEAGSPLPRSRPASLSLSPSYGRSRPMQNLKARCSVLVLRPLAAAAMTSRCSY